MIIWLLVSIVLLVVFFVNYYLNFSQILIVAVPVLLAVLPFLKKWVDELKERKSREVKIRKQITNYLCNPVVSAVLMVIVTCLLVLATGVLAYATFQLVEVNQRLTDVTEEFYKYHPPRVNVIYGQVVGLYVFRNESYSTHICMVGVSRVYNEGIADDVAVVRQKHLGKVINTTLEERGSRDVRKIDAILSFEGSPYPMSVPAGGPTIEIPILLTCSTKETLKLNSTVNIIIGEDDILLEVRQPITEELIDNVSALTPMNVTYKIGDKTAEATIDGIKFNLDVRYTEDADSYKNWKEKFLSEHGVKARFIFNPVKSE